MVLYLFGPDSYRRQKKAADILSAYEKKHSKNGLARFYLDESPDKTEELKRFLNSPSLFSEKKLALAYCGKKSATGELKKILKEFLNDKDVVILLICDEKLPKTFDFLNKEPVKKEEFALLEGRKKESFILREAKERGAALTSEQVRALARTEDSFSAAMQIEVLALGGELQESAASLEFFPLVSAISSSSSDISKKLLALDNLIRSYEPAAAFNVAAAICGLGAKEVFADCDIEKKSGKLDYEEILLKLAIS